MGQHLLISWSSSWDDSIFLLLLLVWHKTAAEETSPQTTSFAWLVCVKHESVQLSFSYRIEYTREQSLSLSLSLSLTHTHTHTHSKIHTHSHSLTHSLTHSFIHSHTLSLTHTNVPVTQYRPRVSLSAPSHSDSMEQTMRTHSQSQFPCTFDIQRHYWEYFWEFVPMRTFSSRHRSSASAWTSSYELFICEHHHVMIWHIRVWERERQTDRQTGKYTDPHTHTPKVCALAPQKFSWECKKPKERRQEFNKKYHFLLIMFLTLMAINVRNIISTHSQKS